jgi:hypothetical protein
VVVCNDLTQQHFHVLRVFVDDFLGDEARKDGNPFRFDLRSGSESFALADFRLDDYGFGEAGIVVGHPVFHPQDGVIFSHRFSRFQVVHCAANEKFEIFYHPSVLFATANFHFLFEREKLGGLTSRKRHSQSEQQKRIIIILFSIFMLPHNDSFCCLLLYPNVCIG